MHNKPNLKKPSIITRIVSMIHYIFSILSTFFLINIGLTVIYNISNQNIHFGQKDYFIELL